MTDSHDVDDLDLERFFRAARTAAPEPDAAFLARLTAQGLAVQAGPVVPARVPARRGVLTTLVAALGGWTALGGIAGGMATATVAGLWIGLAGMPTLVQAVGLGSAVTTVEADSYLPDADVLALAITQ